jgi:hypothetical protein
MARALQCPSCSTTMPLEGHEAGETIRCGSCGQAMKVPPGLSKRSGSARSPAGASMAAVPAPRRGSRATVTAGGAAAGAAGGTAVLTPSTPPPARPVSANPVLSAGPDRRNRSRDAGGRREALPLWLRILVWVIALPLGLVIVGVPARQAGYLTSQKLLDVIVKHDLDRFVPIVVIVALWALVTALLVTALVEGGRWWMLRRRARNERDSFVVSS